MKYIKTFQIISLIILSAILFACDGGKSNKIRLAQDDADFDTNIRSASSVLQVKAEKQIAITVIHFENQTNEASLDWLQRGLADLLTTELSQSPYVKLISMNRLLEISERLKDDITTERRQKLLNAARAAQVEIVLIGKYFNENDSLSINVDIVDVQNQKIIRSEVVRGTTLERIFPMVAELSDRVRSNLRGDWQEIEDSSSRQVAMTSSLEAFRCFTSGIENIEKYLWTDAEKCLLDAVHEDSTFAQAYMYLGRTYSSMGRRDLAISNVKKARKYVEKLTPGEQLRLEIMEHMFRAEWNEYMAKLEQGVRIFPTDMALRLELAAFYRSVGFTEKALVEYETLLEVNPNQPLIYNELGYLFARRGDFGAAVKNLDKYRELAPNEPNPYDSKGEIYMMAGELDKSVRELETVYNQWPQFYHSAIRLAIICMEQGKYSDALRYINHAIAQAPGDEIAKTCLYYRGMVHWRFGNEKDARADLSGLLTDDPFNIMYIVSNAEMLEYFGNRSAAVDLLRSSFENYLKQVRSQKPEHQVNERMSVIALDPRMNPAGMLELIGNEADYPEKLRNSVNFQFMITMLNHRVGAISSTSRLVDVSADYFEGLGKFNRRGWSATWQYLFEYIGYTAEFETNPFVQAVNQVAEEYKRDDLTIMLNLARASVDAKQGRQTSSLQMLNSLGFPAESQWMVAGPFSCEGRAGFDNPFQPEKSIGLQDQYRDGNWMVSWKKADDPNSDGFIDLRASLKHSTWAAGYGLIYLHTPVAQNVQIHNSADGAIKLWLNDNLVWKRFQYEDAMIDYDRVTVALHQGYNKLLVKVINADNGWGFYLRVTDDKGQAVSGLRFVSADEYNGQPLSVR